MITTAYDPIAREFGAARQRLLPKEREYLDLLLAPLGAAGTVLDLGCGTGHPIASHIVARGHRVVGVDGSAAMLAQAAARLPDQRWLHRRLEEVAFDESFHAVVCWDALFHLPRRHFAPVIANIHRWLVPGGRVMVSSGGLVGETGFTDTMFGHEFYYDSLPPDAMVRLLGDTGFDIVRAEMCDPPSGGREKGKWATIGARRA